MSNSPGLENARKAQLDDATLRKAMAEATTAENAAAASTLKRRFVEGAAGPMTGAVTTADGACLAEINLLARHGLGEIARPIAKRVREEMREKGATSLILSSGDTIPSFGHIHHFEARVDSIQRAIDAAHQKDPDDDGVWETQESLRPKALFEGIAAGLSLGIGSINGLLGFLRTDHTLGGATLTIGERPLLLAVRGALAQSPECPVFLDGYFPASSVEARKYLSEKLSELSGSTEKLRRKVEALQKLLEAKPKPEPDKDGGVPDLIAPLTEDERTRIEERIVLCKNAIAQFDRFMTEQAADAAGTPFLERAAREHTLRTELGEKPFLLSLKVDGAWGSTVISRNIWSGLFGYVPVQVSAGVGVSWALCDIMSGRLLTEQVETWRAALTPLKKFAVAEQLAGVGTALFNAGEKQGLLAPPEPTPALPPPKSGQA